MSRLVRYMWPAPDPPVPTFQTGAVYREFWSAAAILPRHLPESMMSDVTKAPGQVAQSPPPLWIWRRIHKKPWSLS